MGMIANMATRYDKTRETLGRLTSGYEGPASPDFEIPSCGPEDVDRAFFQLFNEKLPLYFRVTKDSSEQKRIPVIFATGERFSVASKREPFRDKNGALILPIVSISRSGIEQDSTKQAGVAPINEMTIRKRISPEDGPYQNLQNSGNFRNAQYSKEGDGNAAKDYYSATGRTLRNSLGANLYEVFVIPMPKFFTLKYEVTLWCQYVQQANDFISAIMGAYIQPSNRTVKIETNKGYWFVAYFDPSVSQDNNFSDSSDTERIIKVTLTAEVPAYLLLPKFPGSPNGMRKYVSAPQISFASYSGKDNLVDGPNVPSGKVDTYILSEIETVDDGLRPDRIGGTPLQDSISTSNGEGVSLPVERGVSLNDGTAGSSNVTLGGQSVVKSRKRTEVLSYDPYTGKEGETTVTITEVNPAKGEQVLFIDLKQKRNR
jgi:hypothetical protein